MRRLLAALALACCAVAAAEATAVVVMRTRSAVILAADSQMTAISGRGERSAGTGCKIATVGRWHLLFGGLMTTAGLDIPAATARAVGATDNMNAALAALGQEYRASIRPTLATERRSSRSTSMSATTWLPSSWPVSMLVSLWSATWVSACSKNHRPSRWKTSPRPALAPSALTVGSSGRRDPTPR